jgi:hypothetical protein
MFICLLYWCINKKFGVYVLTSYLFGFITNAFLKVTACIYRPWILDSRVKPLPEAIPAATGYSFPSGHTAGAVSIWGSMIILLWKNKLVRYSLFALIFMVMMSRNYLGVHTPQDVIVSFVVTSILVILNKRLLDWEEKTNRGDIVIVLLVSLITALLACYVVLKSYPMDYLNGKLLYDTTGMKLEICARTGFVYGVFYGWLIEKHFVRFEPELGSVFSKIVRYILGVGVLIFIHKFAGLYLVHFLPEVFADFVGYLVMGFFLTCLYPFVLKKITC